MHLDVKPSNFLVSRNGVLKICDFELSKRAKDLQCEEYFEGDSKYLALEALSSNFKNSNTCYKVDVFSLGLSFAEILFKIELPQSGILWERIRSDNFRFENEQLLNSNMKNNIDIELINLIYTMIHVNIDLRPTVDQIFERVNELNIRNKKMLKNQYVRVSNPSACLLIEYNMVGLLYLNFQ